MLSRSNSILRRHDDDEKRGSAGVISLLEKYSNLHRNIDRARKQLADYQNEIDNAKSDIEQIIENDRPSLNDNIENAIKEKNALLETLENLITTDLVNAQSGEMIAKSNFELAKLQESNVTKSHINDQHEFLSRCESFRDKVSDLFLRGECFGLTTAATSANVYAVVNSLCSDSSKENSSIGFNYSCEEILDKMIGMVDSNKNSTNQEENNEELEGWLRQLSEQKERNDESRKILQEERKNREDRLEAQRKQASKKKELQSQYKRLQRSVHDIQSKIENLKQQSKETQAMTEQFRKDVERGNSIKASISNSCSRSTFNDRGNNKDADAVSETNASICSIKNRSGRTLQGTPLNAKKRKSAFNPYARATRRQNRRKENTTFRAPCSTLITRSPKSPSMTDEKKKKLMNNQATGICFGSDTSIDEDDSFVANASDRRLSKS